MSDDFPDTKADEPEEVVEVEEVETSPSAEPSLAEMLVSQRRIQKNIREG